MIMNPSSGFRIGIFWSSVSVSALEIFRASTQFWEKLGLSADRYRLFRKVFNEHGEDREWTELLPLSEIEKLLMLDDATSFRLDCNYKLPMISYSEVPNSSLPGLPPTGGLASLGLNSDRMPASLDYGDFFAHMASGGRLCLGVVECFSYVGWQIMTDKKRYSRKYGSIDGFREKIIKHTPPLDDVHELDTSLNPGSRRGTQFQPQSISSELWIGPHFWTYAPCTKEEVLAADFFIEKRDTPHYLYLKSWPHPFTRPDGEQGRVQQKLWRLLYHQDCEWPPGSGGISDVPVGGPPELMP
jgi:hypothetical protein